LHPKHQLLPSLQWPLKLVIRRPIYFVAYNRICFFSVRKLDFIVDPIFTELFNGTSGYCMCNNNNRLEITKGTSYREDGRTGCDAMSTDDDRRYYYLTHAYHATTLHRCTICELVSIKARCDVITTAVATTLPLCA